MYKSLIPDWVYTVFSVGIEKETVVSQWHVVGIITSFVGFAAAENFGNIVFCTHF